MTKIERACAVLGISWDIYWRLTGELFWTAVFKVMGKRG